ncbi:TetR/AcrR family transcriptional regulator [Siculibacillus lacustris]|uniref:TetR/AcrR family transcriptional regulator n=1 Tax=Siculibacillus lacustris TaxID=1549641 RepID=A0A4Q9VX47_9HYPH|nr:TetR/AcrR family transcriptional regulator [Siculibacillus lacustris]TBW40957.1 TetR/AcrR family transcriptional regulator [Siculibacillus lacustris]
MTEPDAHETRADTRTRILDTADRLFGHYGYGKTTVADIARELGMSPANVYRFFASKLEIVEAKCERMLAQRHAYNLEIVASGGSAADRLRRFFIDNHRLNLEAFVSDPKTYEIVEVAMAEEWETIQAHLVRMTDVLEALIAEGVAAGEFPPQADIRRSAVCARQAHVSLFHPTLLRQCADDIERAGPEELSEFILRALRCP